MGRGGDSDMQTTLVSFHNPNDTYRIKSYENPGMDAFIPQQLK
jgi:hypothetical protein